MSLEARIRLTRPWLQLDLSIEVPSGTTSVLLGPNGAGKTTAVMAIAGHVPIDEGRIRIGDRVLDDPDAGVFVPPEERKIGVVFQERVLFPTMDVVDNVAFSPRSRGRGQGPARQAAMHWLDRLGLAGIAHRRPGDLSGGEAQRVALARALNSDPELLLLDEPLSSLDATTRTRVRRMITTHLDEFPGPRLVITHDPVEASLLGDEVFVVEKGVLTQRGPISELRLRPATPYVADLVGTNLLAGVASGDQVEVDGHVVQVAGARAAGPVSLTIHPRAVGLHLSKPSGSARNTWETQVTVVEDLGERVRLEVGDPLPLTAEVTPAAVADLALTPGSPVWVSIKATEIIVNEG